MSAPLTKTQWLAKLQAWLPAWFFESPYYQQAHLSAMAQLMSAIQSDATAFVTEAFILGADGAYLDQHGADRALTRNPGETDAQFAVRIQNIVNLSNCTSIKQLVDGLLLVLGNAGCRVQDHAMDPPACARGTFCGRGKLLADDRYNHFSVVVPAQASLPTLQAIQMAVDAAKALGSLYRIVELNKPSL